MPSDILYIYRVTHPPVDLDLGCSVIMPGLWVAAVEPPPGLSALSQREFFTILMGHPVVHNVELNSHYDKCFFAGEAMHWHGRQYNGGIM